MINAPERLLALNVRASRIGYVLFDGPDRLLDWGTRAIPAGERREIGRMRVASLLLLTSPSEIVISRARRKRDVDSRDALGIAALVRREAFLRFIPVASAGSRAVERRLPSVRAANKYEMAAAAARSYPEIFWKLPSGRKRWQTEPRVMLVFDALTAGLAFWRQHGNHNPNLRDEKRMPR